jgi:uncharacterized membrane-anchored protein YitT (DUF2179 family)
MTAAIFSIAAAVFFFLMPSHAAIASIAGLSIVLHNFVPLSVSAITMILNIALLIIGFIFCGREFGIKTVYTTIMLPVFMGLLEFLFPDYQSITADPVLDAAAYIFSVSIGMSILFNMNASSGGLDVVAKILNKYFHMNIGSAVSVSGLCLALTSALAYDKKTVVISVLGTYINGLVVDHFIFGQNVKRKVCILSDHYDTFRRYIISDLHSGATIYEPVGAFDGEKKHEIVTIVDKSEYQKLMSFITVTDPAAFVTVYTVSDMRYRPKP